MPIVKTNVHDVKFQPDFSSGEYVLEILITRLMQCRYLKKTRVLRKGQIPFSAALLQRSSGLKTKMLRNNRIGNTGQISSKELFYQSRSLLMARHADYSGQRKYKLNPKLWLNINHDLKLCP